MKARTVKKLGIVAAAALIVVFFLAYDLDRYLTLSYIKESQAQLMRLYEQNPFMVIIAYMGLYVTVTALSLPGAVILTLVGGALLGLVTGTIVISIASTTGATLACFVSRFILRDWVEGKFGDKIASVNRGVEKEGPLYLFSVRLIPIFPFFVINLVMGLTRMPLRTFFWVSQLGMLPGTIVYVNAGKQLGQISSASGILSPSLILSFVILGVFPIAAKKIMKLVRRKVVDKPTVDLEKDT